MMSSDEEATFELLRAHRAVAERVIARHGGRIFSTAGDSFLAEFSSAVEAVRCAIAVQEDLAQRNAELAENRQIRLRIGVNVGDVLIEGGDLFGDGVNVAARLEGLAEPGGICISGSTFDQVKSKLSVSFEDIGAQRVKNIPNPVPAFRLVPGGTALPAGARIPAQVLGLSRRVAAAMAVAVFIACATYLIWPATQLAPASQRFDGNWRVTIDGLTGCKDLAPRFFDVTIHDGFISQPEDALPKRGEVSAAGRVTIQIEDTQGAPLSALHALLDKDRGDGRFQGRKPACTGNVRMERLP